jgi:hypothetical protein
MKPGCIQNPETGLSVIFPNPKPGFEKNDPNPGLLNPGFGGTKIRVFEQHFFNDFPPYLVKSTTVLSPYNCMCGKFNVHYIAPRIVFYS